MLTSREGNKPPWTLPAKALYSTPDAARAKRYFGIPDMQTPSFFPILSLLPQRALVYIKATYIEAYIPVFLSIFSAMWEHNKDVSDRSTLSTVLATHFSPEQVKNILDKATTPEIKATLNSNTKEALDQGAFGCPWFWVRNLKGEHEPFFGSDRYVQFPFGGADLRLPVRPSSRRACEP